MAHPRQISDEVIQKAHDLIAQGYKTKDVCAHPDIDVTRTSWYRWREIGKEHYDEGADPEDLGEYDALCLKFYKSLEAAEVLRKGRLEEAWHAAALDGEWRAAMEYLARNYPEEYARKTNVDLTSEGERVDFSIVLTDDDGEEDDE